MYRGYNLSLGNADLTNFIPKGKNIHEKNKSQVASNLESFKDADGNLVASEIIEGWFPPINSNIFLSHSHKDAEQVIGLSGWLYQTFGLTSFIDSCIWGYSENLLRIIDDEYCFNHSRDTYSYKKRNRSTSHVYMMLSTALAKMINTCECIIFVNTPHSISPKNYIEDSDTTDSPWIYSEIAMTSLVQKRSPQVHRGITIKAGLILDSAMGTIPIRYNVKLNHLFPMTIDDLNNWSNKNEKIGVESLDTLYGLI